MRIFLRVMLFAGLFGSAMGQTVEPFNPNLTGTAYALAVLADGRILVGGNFSLVGGVAHHSLVRLNVDGTVDPNFSGSAVGTVYALAQQENGKTLVAGNFTTLSGATRSLLGRLNSDGTLDSTFAPSITGSSAVIAALAVQPDGKILIGGSFSSVGGQKRVNLARLNADGSLDGVFNPSADGVVNCLLVQPDGNIVVGGAFANLGGQARSRLGRLVSSGALDSSFNPGADGIVNCLEIQPNGSLLIGGYFTTLGGIANSRLGRLTSAGAADDSFAATANSYVSSFALQTDGKLLVSGDFTNVNGVARGHIARVNSDGTLDLGFTPGANTNVYALAQQADGKVLVGGPFSTLLGQSRSGLGRFSNDAATQNLTYNGFNITWSRSGAGPEVRRTTFFSSTDQTNWSSLGDGVRSADGWGPVNWDLPPPGQVQIKARGFLSGANQGASSWYIEFTTVPTTIATQPMSQTNTTGATAGFSIVMAGTGPFTYQWRKGSTNLADGNRVQGSQAAALTLSNLLGSDAGAYSVAVNDGANTLTSQVAVLTVVGDPSILTPPASATAMAGTVAMFSVQTVGTPPAYQWRKGVVNLSDAGNVSGSKSATLTLSNVLGGDAGFYSVVASNSFGSVTSAPAVLTVTGDPSIVSQPSSLTLGAGSTANYTVLVAGTAPAYFWTKDGASLSDGGTISGAHTATLSIANVMDPARGIYSVIVSNAFGMITSSTAGLLVTGDPAISTQPTSQTGILGHSITLSGQGWGTPPLDYQWLKDGLALADGANVSGARASSLTLSNLQLTDGGTYNLVVHNPYDSASSRDAVLTIVTDPLISSQPASQTNNAGTAVTFTVGASGNSGLSYQWQRNGSPLSDGGNISGAHSSALSLSSIFGADGGSYLVVVTDANGSQTSSVATLKVRDPLINLQPVGQTVPRGANVTLTGSGFGTAPLAYQWRQGGQPVSGATASAFTLQNVQATNAGNYDFVVSNSWGSATSAVAVLSVNSGSPDALNISANNSVYALAPLPDGETLVGGAFATLGTFTCNGLGRLRTDGVVDTSFPSGSAGAVIYSLAPQADGSVYVAGSFTSLGGVACTNLGRLKPDGTLDPNFRPTLTNTVNAVVLQPDGSVVIGGSFVTVSGQPRLHLARLKSDGTVDTGFVADASGNVNALLVQPDGKVLVGGIFSTLAGSSCRGLGRLNADGSLDSAFQSAVGTTVNSLALQPDGALLAGGLFLSGQAHMGIARLHADGSFDDSFSATADQVVNSLTLQADGSILLGGNFLKIGNTTRNHLARLNADGSLDPFFDPSPNLQVYAVAVQADGKVLIGGAFTSVGTTTRTRLARLTNPTPPAQTVSSSVSTVSWVRSGSSPEVSQVRFDGSSDGRTWVALGVGTRRPGGWQLTGTFAPPGITLRAQGWSVGAFGSGSTWLTEQAYGPPAISRQPVPVFGSLGGVGLLSVQACGSPNLSYQWYSLARGQPALIPNATNSWLQTNLIGGVTNLPFQVVVKNDFGTVTSSVATVSTIAPDSVVAGPNDTVYATAFQPDGKLLVAGAFTALGGTARTALARLNPIGSLDTTFVPNISGTVYCLGVQEDGKIIIGGGFTAVGGQTRSVLARLNPDASLDTSFAAFQSLAPFMQVDCLALQPDGRILVGLTVSGVSSGSGLVRLNSDGSVDSSFTAPAYTSTQGISTYAVTVQPDGNILAFGKYPLQPVYSFAGQRLDSNGTLVSRFLQQSFNISTFAQACALQPDGSFLVGGQFIYLGAPCGLLKINPDLTGDTNYEFIGGTVDSLSLQADGKAFASGYFSAFTSHTQSEQHTNLIRINPNGTIDSAFRLGTDVNGAVSSLALGPDGKLLMGGSFTNVGGFSRTRLARLISTVPGTQTLSFDGSTATWLRSDNCPDVWRTTLAWSQDGVNWNDLGSGTRIPGGWQWSGLAVPLNCTLRAHGFINQGCCFWLVESKMQYSGVVQPIQPTISTWDNALGIQAGHFGFDVLGQAGEQIVIETSTDLVHWTPLQTNVVPPIGDLIFSDPNLATGKARFYRARSN